MRKFTLVLLMILGLNSCTTPEKLAYLNNLNDHGSLEYFTMSVPDYKIQYRDILYITIKAMTPDGTIRDFLSTAGTMSTGTYSQSEASQYLYGYEVGKDGKILLPVIGSLPIAGSNLEEARYIIQNAADNFFKNSTVECKLLSFKFTVIGEVKAPGTYINYNNYLTVFEALGRAGGVSDFARHDRIQVIRPFEGGTKTFVLNLQDKSILTNEAYFLLPNDVIIVEPESRKIFNLNLPIFSFIITSATSVFMTTLLLIEYFK